MRSGVDMRALYIYSVPDGGAEVGLATAAELALPTLRDVQWDHVVTGSNRGDP